LAPFPDKKNIISKQDTEHSLGPLWLNNMEKRDSEQNYGQDDSIESLRCRDEILQVMYWMHGENLGTEIKADEILRFLDLTLPKLLYCLEQLRESGYVEAATGEKYRLTGLGLEEGKRRFIDEFEPLLKSGHGACNDPMCDCHAAESVEHTCRSLKEVNQ
jgi:hypothetical protein